MKVKKQVIYLLCLIILYLFTGCNNPKLQEETKNNDESTTKREEKEKMKEEYKKSVEEEYGLNFEQLRKYVFYFSFGCTQYQILYEEMYEDGTIDESKEFMFYDSDSNIPGSNPTKRKLALYNYFFFDHPDDEIIEYVTKSALDKEEITIQYKSEQTKEERIKEREEAREVLKRYGFDSENRLTIEWALENPYDAYHMMKQIPMSNWIAKKDIYLDSYLE